MKATEHFAKFAGQHVRVINNPGDPIFVYVLADGDLDESGMADFMGDLHPKGALEPGWTVVAVEGEVEDNEASAGGFIAVHDATDTGYASESGTKIPLRGPASKFTILPGHE